MDIGCEDRHRAHFLGFFVSHAMYLVVVEDYAVFAVVVNFKVHKEIPYYLVDDILVVPY
jgi:hypothetical protein